MDFILDPTYLPGVEAAVTYSSRDFFNESAEPVSVAGTKGIVPWGEDNNLPEEVIAITEANPVAMPSLDHKIDVIYGGGVKYGTLDEKGNFKEASRDDKKGKYAEIETFFKENNIPAMMSELITDMVWFANGFIEIILNRDTPARRKVTSIGAKEAYFSRWETANPKTGMVENHVYADWSKTVDKNNSVTTPVLWSKNYITDLERRIGRKPYNTGILKDDKKFRYIMPVRLPYPGRLYYPKPYWYSIIKSGWLEFANKIPEFKKTFMRNSINVKFHVEIHRDYFPKKFAERNLKTKKEQTQFIKAEFKSLNDFLAGVKNSGKSMITYYHTTPDGKEAVKDIRIHVIDNKLGGEYLDDSHEASAMIAYAMRTHPSLIGVIPGKTTSNLSGSDKRELLRIQQSLQKRTRDAVLQPLYLVKAINRWAPEIEFGIPDIFLTTLDKGKETDKQIQI